MSSTDNTLMRNNIIDGLNSRFSQYGIRFKHNNGDFVEWISKYASSSTTLGELTNMEVDIKNYFDSLDDKGKCSKCVLNIFLLPVDSQIQGGKSFTVNGTSNIILVGGTRQVQFCGFANQPTEIAKQSNVVAHEAGHCLGLLHTQDAITGDGDGLSDTPLDFNIENGCVTPNSNCNVIYNNQSSNACQKCPSPMPGQTLVVDNVMSYAHAGCMKNFSTSQVAIMRHHLQNTSTVVNMIDLWDRYTVMGPPQSNINFTYNFGTPAGTLNFISAGGYFLNTNINPNTVSINGYPVTLNNPIAWNAVFGSNGPAYGNPMGSMDVNYFFSLVAGQSVTIQAIIYNSCGSLSKTTTFIARSGYNIYSRQSVQGTLGMEFSPTEYIESLPENIIVYDEKTGKKEKIFDVRDTFKKEKKNPKFAFDVKELGRGVKILHLVYPESGKKDKSPDIVAERINLVN